MLFVIINVKKMILKVQEKPPMYSNPELDMIQKDIDELVKERLILETEIAQKEADLKIRSGEVKSLQVNLQLFLCLNNKFIIINLTNVIQ